jgi:hypothetical protein
MRVLERPLAARPGSLAGWRLGIRWNEKPNANILLGRLRELLAERYGAMATAWEVKPVASAPAPSDVIQKLIQECDVVVNAVGD